MTQEILSYIDNIDAVTQETSLDVMVSIYDSLVKSSIILEEYNGESLNGFAIFQEGVLDDVKKQGKNENFAVRALKFIPRLLMAIVNAIRQKFSKKSKKSSGDIDPKKLEELQEVESSLSKAFKAVGIAVTIAGGGYLAFRVYESTDSVEFKDDVKFMISTDGSQLRIIFPFYKIEGMKEFNERFSHMRHTLDINDNDKIKKIIDLFDLVVINQARISERDFTIQSWEEYYDKEVKTTFDKFGNNLEQMAKMLTSADNIDNSAVGKILLTKTQNMSQKIVTDINMISKFNDKLHQTIDLLSNPDQQSWFDKKKLSKITFEPVPPENAVDIYQIDTTYLQEAAKIGNDFIQANKKQSVDYGANNFPLEEVVKKVEQQFNCKIEWSRMSMNSSTSTGSRIDGNRITFSRTKGFDLGGMLIKMKIGTDYDILINRGKFVGQAVVATICHEIFHNVARSLAEYDHSIQGEIKRFAAKIDDKIADPLVVINDFIISITKKLGLNKNKNEFEERVKQQCIALMRCDNEEQAAKVTKQIANGIIVNTNTPTGKTELKNKKRSKNFNESSILFTGLATIVYSSLDACFGGLFSAISMFHAVSKIRKLKRTLSPEEMMADTFAAVYKLPTKHNPFPKDSGVKDLRDSNALITLHDEHPASFDRDTISANLAKEMLYSGKITDEETKKYLKYIIDSGEGNNTKERHLSKGQLKRIAPQFTSNINRAITNYINDNNIQIKE